MQLRDCRNFLLIILLIGGDAYAQTQLPKCVLFGFGNCVGTLRFSNGDIYTGEFNYGKPNGKGAFTYGNGDSYSGTVVEGQRHGSGTYISAAGDKYVGQFSDSKFDGLGAYYFLANNRFKGDTYVGEFSSNTFNGQGRYTHANGQIFVGSFLNGRKVLADFADSPKSELIAVDGVAVKQTNHNVVVTAKEPKVVAAPVLLDEQMSEQALAEVAKSKVISASVYTTLRRYELKDSAVPDPHGAGGPAGKSAPSSGERSKWYGTSGLGVAQSYYCYYPCTTATTINDVGLFFGGGYEFSDHLALEGEIFPWTTQTVKNSSGTYSLSSDIVGYKVGALLSTDLSKQLKLLGGGGYYMIDVTSMYSLTSGSQSQHFTYDNFYLSVGAALKITESTSLRLKWSRYPTKSYGVADSGGFETYDVALKYNF